MLEKAVFFLLAVWVLAVSSCETTDIRPDSQYAMSVQNDQTIIAFSEPRLNSKTGFYRYRDQHGQHVLIHKEVVRSITPVVAKPVPGEQLFPFRSR